MQRYYNIELLRFLCALTVAIYHWGLSFELMMMENNDTFRDLLNFAYDHGANAVPVFFVISGLVFANVYLSQEKMRHYIILQLKDLPDFIHFIY